MDLQELGDTMDDESESHNHDHHQTDVTGPDSTAADADMATAVQAKSSIAKSLLYGEILSDVVGLHKWLFRELAAQKLPNSRHASKVPDVAREQAHKLCYDLGTWLLGAAQGLLPAGVDDDVRCGHIMRLCLEHRTLGKAAAASSAQAAAVRSHTTANTSGSVSHFDLMAEDALDMQQPAMEEVPLMLGPVSAVALRLNTLLEEWPDHPLLQQLLAICQRLSGLPLTSPLKQALTGLELLLARAQV